MKAYFLQNSSHVLDENLESELKLRQIQVEQVILPTDHEGITDIFGTREMGVIFLPPAWEDLFSVKVIDEIQSLKTPFETVIVGAAPSVSNLVVAFNNGLTAYLETPVENSKLNRVISRVTSRLKKKLNQMQATLRLTEYESGSTPHYFTPKLLERDWYLARALLDFMNNDGPIKSGSVRILLVTASAAQEKRLENLLTKVGIFSDSAGSMEEAVKNVSSSDYAMIISDSVLPDGDAVMLVNRLRKSLKSHMPRFVVWSSSPDKTFALLRPENHIDDVLTKPGPGTGMESILPAIIAGIYQTRS